MWNDDSGETCDIIRNTTTSVKSRRPWTSTKMHTYARLLGVWNLEKPECEQKWRKEKTKKYTDHWRHKDDIRLEVVAAGRGGVVCRWELGAMGRGRLVSTSRPFSVEACNWTRACVAQLSTSPLCAGGGPLAHARTPCTPVLSLPSPRLPSLAVSFWSRRVCCCRRRRNVQPYRLSTLCHHQRHGTQNTPPVLPKKASAVTRYCPSFIKHQEYLGFVPCNKQNLSI